MSGKLSFRSALVAIALAVLTVLQATSAWDYPQNGEFDALAGDCNAGAIRNIQRPKNVKDPNRSVEISPNEFNDAANEACGMAGAQELFQQPKGVNDTNRAVEITVSERNEVETVACGRAGVQELCKFIGFKSAVQIVQDGVKTRAQRQ